MVEGCHAAPGQQEEIVRVSVPKSAPNHGLQATANSLRSYLALAIGGA
jgi:hypothetical protein